MYTFRDIDRCVSLSIYLEGSMHSDYLPNNAVFNKRKKVSWMYETWQILSHGGYQDYYLQW